MNNNQMRCPRCLGNKKMYKMGSGYCAVDCGGAKVDCPMCLGVGTVKTREQVLKESIGEGDPLFVGVLDPELPLYKEAEKLIDKFPPKIGRPKREVTSEL